MEAKEFVEVITNQVNSTSHKPEDFIFHMKNQHRTLQQSFTRLCLNWLKYLSTLEENQYDLRNAESVRLSKIIIDALEGDHYLPLI